jgi:hypothetical protein
MNDETKIDIAVRNPAGILHLERLLCGKAEVLNILSPGIREALMQGIADPSAARVPLCVDVLLALFDWLLARGWERPLESEARFRATVREVFERLSAIIKQGGNARNTGVEESLVVRYLVAMASCGVDVRDRAQIMAATFHNDAFLLPKYWPAPAETWRQNVTEEDWSRFLTAWERFWSDTGRGSGGRNRRKRERRKSLHEHLSEQGLQAPTRQQKREAVCPLRETELENDVPPLDRHRQSAHAGLSAFATQIVVDSRPLAVGLKLLERLLRLAPDKQSPRRCACMALVETAIFSGLAVHDGLKLALTPTKALVPATFNGNRGCLTSHLAFGYHRAILGRIPPQEVDLPLPLHTRDLLQRLADHGYRTVAEPFGPKPLDAFLEDVADLMATSGMKGFLRRLEMGWLYAAHRLARLNPGVIALLRGDVFGPYRSETSYLTVSEHYLWACAYKVHDEILHALGLNSTEHRDSGRPNILVGKQAAALSALVDSANAILDELDEPNKLAACTSWIQQLHGRRPTTDHPLAAEYAVPCDGGAAIFLADKNMGGGRRIRIVPTTQSGFDAAMVLRSK